MDCDPIQSEAEISKHTKKDRIEAWTSEWDGAISVDVENKVARSDPDCDPGISLLILEILEQVTWHLWASLILGVVFSK